MKRLRNYRVNQAKAVVPNTVRNKRDTHRQRTEDAQLEDENKVLKVTEFVTVSEVATMMDVPVTQIISACMSLE